MAGGLRGGRGDRPITATVQGCEGQARATAPQSPLPLAPRPGRPGGGRAPRQTGGPSRAARFARSIGEDAHQGLTQVLVGPDAGQRARVDERGEVVGEAEDQPGDAEHHRVHRDRRVDRHHRLRDRQEPGEVEVRGRHDDRGPSLCHGLVRRRRFGGVRLDDEADAGRAGRGLDQRRQLPADLCVFRDKERHVVSAPIPSARRVACRSSPSIRASAAASRVERGLPVTRSCSRREVAGARRGAPRRSRRRAASGRDAESRDRRRLRATAAISSASCR